MGGHIKMPFFTSTPRIDAIEETYSLFTVQLLITINIPELYILKEDFMGRIYTHNKTIVSIQKTGSDHKVLKKTPEWVKDNTGHINLPSALKIGLRHNGGEGVDLVNVLTH